jgi:hypothetical protein
MYRNGEMISVGTIPGLGRGEIRENDGGDVFKYDIFVIL